MNTHLYINGQWQSGISEIENRNPSDLSDIIGNYAQASADQLQSALDAARAAQPVWWAAGIQKRHDVMMAIGT
jgi:acyl-CoA reductase-like NAD-dependent aldehyde dehydrogenase